MVLPRRRRGQTDDGIVWRKLAAELLHPRCKACGKLVASSTHRKFAKDDGSVHLYSSCIALVENGRVLCHHFPAMLFISSDFSPPSPIWFPALVSCMGMALSRHGNCFKRGRTPEMTLSPLLLFFEIWFHLLEATHTSSRYAEQLLLQMPPSLSHFLFLLRLENFFLVLSATWNEGQVKGRPTEV